MKNRKLMICLFYIYIYQVIKTYIYMTGVNCIIMVSVLASSAVDRGIEPWSGHTKYYKIDICCFSVKHAALRRKSKDWLAQNQDNVSKWSDMCIHRLLF